MKKVFFIVGMCSFFFFACHNKEDADSTVKFFPVVSYIKSQVAHIDTSLYMLVKVAKEGDRVDTAYIKREEFRNYAQDFLTLPDITSESLQAQYTETKMYDEDLKKVVLNYTPKNLTAEIRRQEVIIQPNVQTGDQVETIYIDQLLDKRDSTVQKRLTWQVGKRFQVITIVQKAGQPDRLRTLEVIWNGFSKAQ